MNAYYCGNTWGQALTRFVEWATFLEISPDEAFERAVDIFSNEHFGSESANVDGTEHNCYYLNMGDTYATTLLIDDDNVLSVTCWGDWYESTERKHCKAESVIRCGHCSHLTPFEYGIDDWRNHNCESCENNVSG